MSCKSSAPLFLSILQGPDDVGVGDDHLLWNSTPVRCIEESGFTRRPPPFRKTHGHVSLRDGQRPSPARNLNPHLSCPYPPRSRPPGRQRAASHHRDPVARVFAETRGCCSRVETGDTGAESCSLVLKSFAKFLSFLHHSIYLHYVLLPCLGHVTIVATETISIPTHSVPPYIATNEVFESKKLNNANQKTLVQKSKRHCLLCHLHVLISCSCWCRGRWRGRCLSRSLGHHSL